jgi:DNA-binding GntR family transcriptional regulator
VEGATLARQRPVPHPAEPSKHEAAYRKIRQRILNGHYGPGYRLVFSSLARDLDISPVPVREAIRRLEAEGLVTFEHNIGARVATLHDDEWEHLIQALALLDGYAVAQAAPRITAEALDEAQETNDAMRRCIGNPLDNVRVMLLHRDFHRTIYEFAENLYIVESLHRVWNRIDASRVLVSLYPAKRLAAAVEEHDDLLARLRCGDDDPATLEMCARQHNLNAIVAIRGRA